MSSSSSKNKKIDLSILTITGAIWSCVLIVAALFVIVYFDMVPTNVGLGPITFSQPTPTVISAAPPVVLEQPPVATVVDTPTLAPLPSPMVEVPSLYPTVAIIPTITPDYALLLKDDFELGISSQWRSEGTWLMTNGRLTPAEVKDSRIYAGDSTWVNYEGDVTFKVTENLYLFVIVRFVDSDNYAEFVVQCGWDRNYFSLYTGDYMLWRIRKNGNTSEVQGTRTETSCRNEEATINFTVVDNVYRATYKGKTISFADPDNALTSGGMGLRFYPFDDSPDALVQFDEVIVRTK